MSNPEIFLFLHLPRVSLPSPALRPGFSSPLTPPFDLSPPTRYPYPLSTRKTPIRSDPSISFHILNIQPLLQPPYLTKNPRPPPSLPFIYPRLQTITCYLREGSGSLSLVLAGRDCRWLGLEERWFAVVGVLEVVVGVGVGLWVRFPEKEHQGRIRNTSQGHA